VKALEVRYSETTGTEPVPSVVLELDPVEVTILHALLAHVPWADVERVLTAYRRTDGLLDRLDREPVLDDKESMFDAIRSALGRPRFSPRAGK